MRLILFMLLFFLFSCRHSSKSGQLEKSVEIKGHKLFIEIADTPEKRQTGLMFRQTLAENRGMLFVFEKPITPNFWMKNTYVDLSIAFISSDKIIKEIIQLDGIRTAKKVMSYRTKHKSLYALEVNKGWFSKRSIQAGDKLSFSF